MAIGLSTIAGSISSISVSGLTIKDIDDIPQNISQRDCPILIPDPDNYVGFSIAPVSLDKSKYNINYSLSYILIYAVLGSERTNIMATYSGMLSMATAIVDAVISLSTLSGAVDWGATVRDPLIINWGGTDYHAIRMEISATEFVG